MNRDIAIIGISGKFPLADNLDQLVDNLSNGRDCVEQIPEQRISQTALPADGAYKKCGFLAGIDKFDHAFFGISFAEARTMCPEQRLALEVTHAAIENAGYAPSSLSGSNTAVFVSLAHSDYFRHATEYTATLVTGNSPEFLAARIARQFNLKGNASAIESSCSSSMVAIHNACNELITGDAEMAIVAGINLVLFPVKKEYNLDLDSPDGKSRAFSAQANGMSYGEIVASVVLKPLEAAIRDKDNIHAVIRSSAVNNNGGDASGITAPDSRTQADVLLKAWRKAGIRGTDLSYIEAHGSGTQLGDSLEVEALDLAFAEYEAPPKSCPISTVKSNMGHGRGAAGIAGLVKTVASLKSRLIFPTIHFDEPNPIIDFQRSAIYVTKALQTWDTPSGKRRLAGVTSIGASGTNCHVVLEEAPQRTSAAPVTTQRWLIPVSGRTSSTLRRNAAVLLQYIRRHPAIAIHDISFTLRQGRDHYEYRSALVADNIETLCRELQVLSEKEPVGDPLTPQQKLVFISSDSGALSDALIDSFRNSYSVFSKYWDQCAAIAGPHGSQNKTVKDLSFQYSFYQLLQSAGITTGNLLPLGIGTILRQVIDAEISLAAGIALAANFVPAEITNKTGRVKNLLDKLAADGPVTLLDLSVEGGLSELLTAYHGIGDQVFFTAPGVMESTGNLPEMIAALYTRGVVKTIPAGLFPGGHRIELPAYSFEPKRCWLRDTPVAIGSHGFEATTQSVDTEKKKFRLREEADAGCHRIAEIVADLLGLDEISLTDDFFELGGDSLLATKAILAINKTYRISLSFEDLFDFPTVGQLADYVAGLLNTEKKLALIWESVLQHENPKAEDNFFDIGGHSLLATTMILNIKKEFQVKLDFEDIFRNQTIKALAAFIDQKIKKQAEKTTKIMPAPPSASYPLSYAQQRMWFLNQFDGGNTAYNNVIGLEMRGPLDYGVFNQALGKMLVKHEALRTIFRLEDKGPVQVILDPGAVAVQPSFINIGSGVDPRERIEQLFGEEYEHVFDMSRFPLFRVKVVHTGGDKHICILNQHHIISDGWSLSVFTEEFFHTYEALLEGKPILAKPLEIQLKDFACWQQGPEFQTILQEQETYWLDQFATIREPLALPLDNARPAVQSFEGDHFYFTIDPAQTAQLKRLARDNGATLYMVLLSAYSLLLSKLSGNEDIAIGVPVAGRRFDGLQPLIGLFVNTVVVRTRPEGGKSFAGFLAEVARTMLQALNNQEYPYESLVQKVLRERDTSRNPLFDTMFILQNNKKTGRDFANIQTTSYPGRSNTVQFDLLVEAFESEKGIEIDFGYATALFHRDTISRMADHFKNIIAMMGADVNRRISAMTILSEKESREIKQLFNNTAADYPRESTILDLFENQVRLHPDQVAVRCNDHTLTYNELNTMAGQVAAYLIGERQVKRGDLVGLLLEREEFLMPAIYGILKAGAVYVPLDPYSPRERVGSIARDAGLSALISRSELLGELTGINGVVDLDRDLPAILGLSPLPAGSGPAGSDLAYVIHTSGSTGKPKGVMIEHHSVVNRLLWMQKAYPIGTQDVILQKTPLVFDVSVWELFWWAITGASVSLLKPGEEKDPAGIMAAIDRDKVTTMHFVPSMLSVFLSVLGEDTDYKPLSSLRQVFASGEALKLEQVKAFGKTLHAANETRLINLYGPTEATVDVSFYECLFTETDTAIPIGKPIDNIRLYILDKLQHLCPIGVAGELFIEGVGVARGYLNNEALTAEKFTTVPALPGQRLYRTGDLARWLPDGNIEYLGRIDQQVKIRGVRIELGEIEYHLSSHPEVTQSVVNVLGKNGDKFLVGYYTGQYEIDAEVLRRFLAERLPEQLVPTYFMHLEHIPLTGNGKIDRKALPEPGIRLEAGLEQPSGETEEKLAAIWANILHLDTHLIGAKQDFFYLGGHSLRAVHLAKAIHTEFGVSPGMRQLFEHSTIRKMAALITESAGSKNRRIPKVADGEYYPTSSAQERMYYEHIQHKEALTYNISNASLLKGVFSAGRLEQAIRQLVDRHESLRTSFNLSENGVVQKIDENVDITLAILDAGRSATAQEAYLDFVRPFDLSKAPLARFALLEKDGESLLFVDVHHIVCDGISLNILMNDFKQLYAGKTLPPTELRYIDYACWQQQSKGVAVDQRNFWKEKLSGELPLLDLPVLQDREGVDDHSAQSFVLEIDAHLYRKIGDYAKSANVTEFVLLLSTFYILLSRMSGNPDIIIGTDVVGRTTPELMDIVGTFVNLLPLRLKAEAGTSFRDFLAAARSAVLEAFENQDFQIDQIAALMNEAGQRKNFIDVHFSFANFIDSREQTDRLEIEPVVMARHESSSYELKLQASEWQDGLVLQFTYKTALYSADIIEAFSGYYFHILNALLSDDSVAIEEIEMEGLVQTC